MEMQNMPKQVTVLDALYQDVTVNLQGLFGKKLRALLLSRNGRVNLENLDLMALGGSKLSDICLSSTQIKQSDFDDQLLSQLAAQRTATPPSKLDLIRFDGTQIYWDDFEDANIYKIDYE